MPFSQGHALLIGVGTYQNEPQLSVPITAADAEAVAFVLRDPAFCGYPEHQVDLLHNATASRDGLLAALDSLAARAGEDDTVLLFYCGHGDYGDDGDYYLTTHDTRLQNRKVVSDSGLRQAELIERLRAIKAKRLLLLVNACHSGELAPTLGADEVPYTGTPLPAQTAAALLSTGEGRIIITACREGQVSYVNGGALTLFTQALVDGLRGRGTSSSRGYLSAFDLYTHVYFTVEEAVQQKYGARQQPELTVLKGVGPFAVSLYRGATTLGDFDGAAPLPAHTAVREVNPAYAQAMHASLVGSGAIAQSGGAAVGERGVYVGGKNTGNINTGTQVGGDLVRGDKVRGDKIRSQINTSGGAYIGGNVSAGGDVVGRDQILTQGVAPGDLESLFGSLLAIVAHQAPSHKQAAAVQQVQELKAEVAKGKQAEDGKIAKVIEDLVAMVPEAVRALVSTFASPILRRIAGPVTNYVLEKLKVS